MFYPIFQAFDNITNLPLAGGQLITSATGTNTPLATYSNFSLSTQNPTTIILDNYGQAVIYLGTNTYRFQLLNAAGEEQAHYPIDNISN